MYLWRRLASPRWWSDNEENLRARFGNDVVVIEQADRKRLQIEIVCKSPALVKKFGGRVERLHRDWLKRFLREQKTKRIKIGNRKLIIPAEAAFGTGEHATTAMSLRLLERAIQLRGAHAPSRADCGALAAIFFQKKSSRLRGRDRQHARRVRSPIKRSTITNPGAHGVR